MNTDIKKTWEPYLQGGIEVEIELLAHIRSVFGGAYRTDPPVPDFDIFVPLKDGYSKTIEVKRDYRSEETGNFCIEYRHNNGDGTTHLSGISITKADIWVQVTPDAFFFMSTKHLKEWLRMNWKSLRTIDGGGDNDKSVMKLVPKPNIVNRGFVYRLERGDPVPHLVLEAMTCTW
jgi:hypothetical protein